jgi:hypothetical protein
MAQPVSNSKSLIAEIIRKSSLKQEVYHNTLAVFNSFKQESEDFVKSGKGKFRNTKFPILFDYHERSGFEFQLKFGSDILIFYMHSNVFEIPRNNVLMKSSYIREDKSRSYCGIIHIFNFLADSFKYNRTNDIGYCIGRIFVNRENHFYTEGKREIGMLYNNFAENILHREAIRSIIYSSVEYTLHFDLLTPPFDSIKEVSVAEMQTTLDTISISTGKRLGFRFQADVE